MLDLSRHGRQRNRTRAQCESKYGRVERRTDPFECHTLTGQPRSALNYDRYRTRLMGDPSSQNKDPAVLAVRTRCCKLGRRCKSPPIHLRPSIRTGSKSLNRLPAVPSGPASVTPSFAPTSLCWTTRRSVLLTRRKTTAGGVKPIFLLGLVMAAFEYRQAT